jgi:hypothetical protein
MFAKRSLWTALGSAALFPATCWAAELAPVDSDALTLTPRVAAVSTTPPAESTAKAAGTRPLMLDDKAESPNIHGFASITFGTAYVTPRGLVVENAGLVVQPVAGIVVPVGDVGFMKNLAVIGGVWNSINTNQDDPNVGAWNEMDFFLSLTAGVAPGVTATLTYGAWNFPQSTINKPETEHNIDLKIAYADKWFGPDFSINPYVDLFWAVAGSSTVVQGATGQTGYAEIGIVPTFKFKGPGDLPTMLVTVPTYVSVGGSEYWGGESNFGVFSAGLNLSIPLNFVPGRYGSWHVDVGAQYYNFLNGTLLDSGTILSGNTDRNFVRGYVGVGMSF